MLPMIAPSVPTLIPRQENLIGLGIVSDKKSLDYALDEADQALLDLHSDLVKKRLHRQKSSTLSEYSHPLPVNRRTQLTPSNLSVDCDKTQSSGTRTRLAKQDQTATAPPWTASTEILQVGNLGTPPLLRNAPFSASSASPTASPSLTEHGSITPDIQVASPSPTPYTDGISNNSQSARAATTQSQHSYAHSKALAAGLLSGVAVIIVLLIAAIILLMRRRRRHRDEKLSHVLDKVASPPNRPDRPGFANQFYGQSHVHLGSSKSTSTSSAPPTIEIPVVPALDVIRLHDRAVDLEANDRHSAELSHQGIVGQTVSRDMSFNWRFPKLSVPPAAARALQSGHYVKKRNTIASQASSPSLLSEKGSPSLSLSSAAELTSSHRDDTPPSLARTEEASVPGLAMSVTMSDSSKSAAPSSSCVDPHMSHGGDIHASTSQQNGRTRWWSSTLQGYACPTSSAASQTGSVRSASAPSVSTLSYLPWGSRATSSASTVSPLVAAANDPLMQEVMQQILFLASGQEPPSVTNSTRAMTTEDVEHPHVAARRHSSGYRCISRAPSALETCREASEEKLEASMMSNDTKPAVESQATPPSTPKNNRSISAAYSAHSIILHDSSDDAKALKRRLYPQSRKQQRQSDVRRSLTPKILLTTTEEDGSHERQLSMTSIDSTSSGTVSSGSGGDDSDSMSESSSFASPRRPNFTSASSHQSNDVASAIGEAFLAHMSAERRIARQKTFEALSGSRYNRESDSTIDSLATFQQHAQSALTSSDSCEGAFNDAYSEAALAEEELTSTSDQTGQDDELTSSCSESTTSFEVKSLTDARPDSMTASESEVACLIDDDFPTIPTWKSFSTQKSYVTTETNNMGWRSNSSMSIATIRP